MSRKGTETSARHFRTSGAHRQACVAAKAISTSPDGTRTPATLQSAACEPAHPHICPAGAHAAVACRPSPGA